MALNLAQKIIAEHLVSGSLESGEEIAIRIDQTLTHDATGPLVYLGFEALGLPCVQTRLSASYVDCYLLQMAESAEEHRYLQSVAAKWGICFSRPGNGICHQVHLERFAAPSQVLLALGRRASTCGALGMLAMEADSLDVSVAMAGGPFFMPMPRIAAIRLNGRLRPWVSAKDVVLEALRRLGVGGAAGRILEYTGPSVALLSVSERAAIANLSPELGAVCSIFPSDKPTHVFLQAQGRGEVWTPLAPDSGAAYDEEIEINLNALEPLVAQPPSLDNVIGAGGLRGVEVDQVSIGGCGNASYRDLIAVTQILRGKTIHPRLSLTITPGSKQILRNLAATGALSDLIASGARVLEPSCAPCFFANPAAQPADGVLLRTFAGGFWGNGERPGSKAYLCSAEVAAASAVAGRITDPRLLGKAPSIVYPDQLWIDDSLISPPAEDPSNVRVVRGPAIQPLPSGSPLPEDLHAKALLKVGDNVGVEAIAPARCVVAGARANVAAFSEFLFADQEPGFASRAKAEGGGIIIGGKNYGHGASREEAAFGLFYLGVKAVVAKSFARRHRTHLIHWGILPLVFVGEAAYNALEVGHQIEIRGVRNALAGGKPTVKIRNLTKGGSFQAAHHLTRHEIEILLAGGTLNHAAAAFFSG